MAAVQETVDRVRRIDVDQYRYGFETSIETDFAPKGLTEDTVRFISAKKNEPEWMLEWRLKAYRRWLTMTRADWAKLNCPADRLPGRLLLRRAQGEAKRGSLDEVDPEILRIYEKLGIPIEEQKVLAGVEGARKVAVDAVFDIRCRSPPPSRRSWRRPASSSARSARRSANIPSW